MTGGGNKAIQQQVQEDHQRKIHDIDMYRNVAKSSYDAYLSGKRPDGTPMTEDERQKAKNQYDSSWAQYEKLAGTSKNAKGILGKMKAVAGHVMKAHGAQPQPAAGGAAGAGGTATPQGQQGQQTVPPPPQAAAPSGGPQSATVPPPPTRDSTAAGTMQAPRSPQEMAMRAEVDAEQRAQGQKEQTEVDTKDKEYRNQLAANVDPKYQPPHVNALKQEIADIKEAEPGISEEDAQMKAETKVGITPKAKTGQEMEPDFKDQMLVGVRDKAKNKYYTDPATMPPEAKAIYDSAKKVEAEHEANQEAKEGRLLAKSITLQMNQLQNALAASDYRSAKKILETATTDYETALDRKDTMHKNLKSALATGNQQAMLSLVANHIGMTLGAQKGARITRAVWDEAAASTPWWDKKVSEFFHTDPATGEQVFDGWKRGITLAPEQMQQMVDLGDEKVDTLSKHVARIKELKADDLAVRGGRKTVPTTPDGKNKVVHWKRDAQGNLGPE
jgi:hypothetical protein